MVGKSQARDVEIQSAGGVRLKARVWSHPDPRGVLVIAHGFGEHGGCYAHVAHTLGAGAGVEVVAPDLRGHGRSPGRRGVVGHYDELTADLAASLAWAAHHRPGLPLFALGHSNGGQVTVRAALDPSAGPLLSGVILSNPSFRLSFRVDPRQLAIGRFLLRWAPRVTLPARLEPDKLSRDPAMRSFYLDDPLRHARISAPLFFGMVEGGEALLGRVGTIQAPSLMIVSGSDPIVDPEACRLAFDRLGSSDKTMLLFPNMLHEPFNEVGREGVLSDLSAWLDRRLPPRA